MWCGSIPIGIPMDCPKTLSPNLKNEWSITRSIMLKISSLAKLSFFLMWNHLACYLDVFVVSSFESFVNDFLELLFQITDGHAVKWSRLVGWTNGPMYRWLEGISGFGWTDGRTNGQPENIMPPAPKGGGITTQSQSCKFEKLAKNSNFGILQKLNKWHIFWSCLIRCVNIKWIRLVLWKLQSGHNSVHRQTDRPRETNIPLFQLRWSRRYN